MVLNGPHCVAALISSMIPEASSSSASCRLFPPLLSLLLLSWPSSSPSAGSQLLLWCWLRCSPAPPRWPACAACWSPLGSSSLWRWLQQQSPSALRLAWAWPVWHGQQVLLRSSRQSLSTSADLHPHPSRPWLGWASGSPCTLLTVSSCSLLGRGGVGRVSECVLFVSGPPHPPNPNAAHGVPPQQPHSCCCPPDGLCPWWGTPASPRHGS